MNRRLPAWVCLLALCGATAGAATNDIIRLDGMWVDLTPGRPDERPKSSSNRLAIDMDAARNALRPIVLDAPPTAPVDRARAERHMAIAMEHLRQRRTNEALTELRDGLTLDPTHPQLMAYTAVLYAQMQEFERAAEYFQRYLRQFPEDMGMNASYAAILLRLARFDDVEALLARIASLDQDHLPLRFNQLCLDFIRERRTADRTWWIQRSREEIALLLQWLISDQQGLTDMLGEGDYTRLCAVVLGPNALAHMAEAADALAAGQAAWQEGDAAAAEMHLKTAAQWIDTYGLQDAIAAAAEEAGRLDEALAIREAQTRRFPGWAPARIAHGQMLLRLGRREEGLEAMRSARTMAGADEGYREFALAAALALNGKIPEAQRMFTELVQRNPEAFRKWIDADPALRAGFNRVPNHPAILRMLGVPPEME